MHGHMVSDLVMRDHCPHCEGTGEVRVLEWQDWDLQTIVPCSHCHGEELVDHVLAVRLPLMVAHNAGLVG